MSEKADCPLCSKSLYYSGLKKHMFSKNHSDIWNAPSNRLRLQNCYNNGARNTIHIKNIFICFGCKIFTRRDIAHSCPNKTKTLEFIKSILNVPVRIPEIIPEAKTPPLPSLPPPADVEKLQKQLERLKRENTDLRQENQDIIERSEKSEAIFAEKEEVIEALKYVLKFLKSGHHSDIYETIMDNFEEDYQAVLKLIKNPDHW